MFALVLIANLAKAEPDIALVIVPLALIGIFLVLADTSRFTMELFGIAACAEEIAPATKITATVVVFSIRNCLPL